VKRTKHFLHWILLAAAWAVVGAAMCSAAEGIEGPETIEPFKFIDFRAIGDWESAIWDVSPAASDLRTAEGGKTLTFLAPPGTYQVSGILVNFSQKRILQVKKSLTVGQGGPAPDPQPGPGPQPAPGPKIAHLVVVEESSQRTVEAARAIASKPVREALATKGIQWHLLDKDQTAQPWAAAYVRLAGAELPRVFAVSVDDRVVQSFRLPSETGLLEWIARQRGPK
jgi:hypothetical protein